MAKGKFDEDPDYLDVVRPAEEPVETQAWDGSDPIPYPDIAGGDLDADKVKADGPVDLRPGQTDPGYSNGVAPIGAKTPDLVDGSFQIKVEGSGITTHVSGTMDNGTSENSAPSGETTRDEPSEDPDPEPDPEPDPDPDPSGESLTGSEVDVDGLLDRTDALVDPAAEPALSVEPPVSHEGDLEG
ncbi:MAG: hypothetical protein AAGD18_19680 [Actinomycetota bacterium]